MEDKKYYKKVKCFASLRKEKLWLEEMARKGYLLCNITMGIHYTFEITEPKNIVFDVDRFQLPSSPTLQEIRHKEECLAFAEQMGWKEVTHDEDLNYYFAKEYVEGDSNELYEDEMREVRANKYREHYFEKSKVGVYTLIFTSLFIFCVHMIVNIEEMFSFYLICAFIMAGGTAMLQHWGKLLYREMSMPLEEWKDIYLRDNHEKQVVWKCFFTSKQLIHYLNRQSEQGWHIVEMTPFRYTFKQGEPKRRLHLVDSKASVDLRMRLDKKKRLKDKKDWMGQNNDWQVKSVKDAEENGWEFLCASGTLLVLYVGKEEGEAPIPLKTKPLYLHPKGGFFVACFFIGGVLGFLSGFFLM